MTRDEIFKQLSEELSKPRKNQKRIDSLNKALDKSLGTELKNEDLEGAAEYERSRDAD